MLAFDVWQATNADLANRLYASPEVTGSARFSKPKLSQTGFAIEHYAGPVTYKTDNFLAKNRDFVVAEHQVLLQASSQSFVQALFPAEPEVNGNTVSNPSPDTAASGMTRYMQVKFAGCMECTLSETRCLQFAERPMTLCISDAEQGWPGVQVFVGGQQIQAPAAGPHGRAAQDGAPLHPLHQAE